MLGTCAGARAGSKRISVVVTGMIIERMFI